MLKVAICDDSDRDASQLEHYLLSYDKFPLETKLYTNPPKTLKSADARHPLCLFGYQYARNQWN